MGGFLNTLTAPLGVKLFPGGPYPDRGLGDQALAQNDVMNQNLQKYLAQLGPIIAQISQAAGVQNPLDKDQAAPTQDAYGLSPVQQGALNQQQSVDTQAYDNILSKVKANLSARGLANSSAMTAAEVYLQKQLQSQLGQERVQAGQNAYGNRMNALDQIGGLLGSAYGAQQGVAGNRQNLLGNLGQQAIQNNQNSMNQLGQLIGFLYGGGAGTIMGGKKGGSQGQPNYIDMFGGGGGGQNPFQPQIEAQGQQGQFFGNPLSKINWGSIYQ